MLIPLEQQVARLQEEVRQLRLLLGVEEGDFELVRTPRSSQLHRSPEPGLSSEARRPIETTVPSLIASAPQRERRCLQGDRIVAGESPFWFIPRIIRP